jgi:hypothetical protein
MKHYFTIRVEALKVHPFHFGFETSSEEAPNISFIAETKEQLLQIYQEIDKLFAAKTTHTTFERNMVGFDKKKFGYDKKVFGEKQA